MELGPVVAVDGGEIGVVGPIQLLEGGHGFLGPVDQLQQSPGAAGLAEADPRAGESDVRFSNAGLGLADPHGRGFEQGMGLDHFLGHAVLGIEQFQHRLLLLGGPFPNQGPVAGAQVIQGPDDSHIDIEAAAALYGLAVGAALKCPAHKGPAGAAAALEHQAGKQRTKPFLPQPFQRRLHQGLLGRQFRPVEQADGNQVVDRPARRDERNLQLRRLDGNDHGAGVQAEHPVQPGTAGLPGRARSRGFLFQVVQQGQNAVDFDLRHKPPGSRPRPARGSVFPVLPPWPRRRDCRPGGRGPLARRSKPLPP